MRHVKKVFWICMFVVVGIAFSGSFVFAEYDPSQAQIVSDKNGQKWLAGEYYVKFKTSPESGFYPESEDLFIPRPQQREQGKSQVPFGEHSNGQTRAEIIDKLGTSADVRGVLDNSNAIIIANCSDYEAERLKNDSRVLSVNKVPVGELAVTYQSTNSWGLDRMDSTTPSLDGMFSYTATGAGQTIYVLDSGLDLSTSQVQTELSGRASVIWDRNGGSGIDQIGHGTEVAVAAAGESYGVAKDSMIIAAKVTIDDTVSVDMGAVALALNYLATVGNPGDIVNMSLALGYPGGVCQLAIDNDLEDAVRNAYNNGIIMVAAAGNDPCDVSLFSPVRMPEVFVASSVYLSTSGHDVWYPNSRTGVNVSTFAPGYMIKTLNHLGQEVTVTGTSFAAPYVSGLFATGCDAGGSFCSTVSNSGILYDALRSVGVMGTVRKNSAGQPFTDGTPSRFIPQQW